MRKVLLVAAAALLVSTSFACGDASSSSGVIRRGVPSAGERVDHDPSDVEGGDESGNPNADMPPPAPSDPAGQGNDFGVTLSSTQPAVDLGDAVEIDVTVEQKNGFSGEATLSVTGLPSDATATFEPARVTVGASAATAKLTIRTPYTALPSAPGESSAIKIVATSGQSVAEANANFKINPKMTLVIPVNADALRQAGGIAYRDEWGAPFGQNQETLKTQDGNPIVVLVRNADSTNHIIHSQAPFGHGANDRPILPGGLELTANGEPRQRTLTPSAASPINTNGYLHDGANGTGVAFRIRIEVAN
jgi:hypothetical protein